MATGLGEQIEDWISTLLTPISQYITYATVHGPLVFKLLRLAHGVLPLALLLQLHSGALCHGLYSPSITSSSLHIAGYFPPLCTCFSCFF